MKKVWLQDVHYRDHLDAFTDATPFWIVFCYCGLSALNKTFEPEKELVCGFSCSSKSRQSFVCLYGDVNEAVLNM